MINDYGIYHECGFYLQTRSSFLFMLPSHWRYYRILPLVQGLCCTGLWVLCVWYVWGMCVCVCVCVCACVCWAKFPGQGQVSYHIGCFLGVGLPAWDFGLSLTPLYTSLLLLLLWIHVLQSLFSPSERPLSLSVCIWASQKHSQPFFLEVW
jgi:hypothetical protein